jgi:predicted dehydrogenase
MPASIVSRARSGKKEILMRKKRLKRRDFLKGALATGAGLTAWAGPRFKSAWAEQRVLGAPSEIRVAIAGCGGRGSGFLVNAAQAEPDTRIVALCDPDVSRMDNVYNNLVDNSQTDRYTDVRDIFERNDIDVFMTAAPTHWHALMTIWACQAGMDVYCEKPVSHNLRESRLMKLAAERYSRILQIGVQRRSTTGGQAAKAYLADPTNGVNGALGPIQWIHAYWFSSRSGVGSTPWDPYAVGAGFDWNLYAGPASDGPIPWGPPTDPDENDIHSNWHYNWLFGNGDLCNLGIHMFDQARFMAGIQGAPNRVMSIGNRYVHGDAGQAPNIQLTLLDYPDFPVVIENRGLPSAPYSPNPSGPDAITARGNHVLIQCQNGYIFAFDRARVYDNAHAEIANLGNAGSPESDHPANFFAAVRSRDAASLIAPVGDVNPTNDACLVGNASYRMGVATSDNDIRAEIAGLGAAPDRFEDVLTHLTANSVDTGADPLLMGPWLTFNEAVPQVTAVNGSGGAEVTTANLLLTDSYRDPFTIPADVPVEMSGFKID